ncbi:1-phosphatidylinositol 4,5-bisphosphate phosphodiesterase eta-1 isoform X2 [Protopterus annectens]|uniref:1-phosphatidylinositol 4,5-bisphosphate phosphodiesterase eta-1 isoform X2 n=1 Tax=Protopterus annectens TaxID=7888 RepID=UPI001CFBEF67|nr:1-phosphatidylinositol 4,5-bisphosphate phosphodiesterase eta-1 isoform X2 [Protopterus annectens]
MSSYWGLNKHGRSQYCRHFLADNGTFHVERCMSVMQSGTQMIKLKSGTKGLVRLFYLDEHRTCIRWRPSRKSEKAKIVIDSIYKVTEGRQSDIFHRHAEGNFDPSCCFTIYHGNHMDSLDLITSNPEEARTWITGLKYLMAGISDEDSLAKRQRTHDHWMKQTFEEADKNGDGLLNIDEIYHLLHKLNVNLPRRKVRQMFQEADTDENQGTLTFEEFCVFYKMMSLRRDLYLLLMSYSNKKDHLTVEEIANFLKTEQKMTNVTTEYCLDIVRKFEVSEENKERVVLGIDGFTNFMRSPACDIFSPLHYEVNQDMDQPLCNYYIASSHNTYLTGDQLLSQSKTEMYTWVLQDGCRCIEVDCWDGPDGEPVVQHGYTLTSKILLKDVIDTINKYAFVKNEYPVIISIENHCSINQQKKIAKYLKDILGDKLDLSNVQLGESKQLPSPQSLKGKILIKGKKLPHHLGADAEEGDVSDEDSADEIEDDCKLKNSNSSDTNEHQVESFIKKKLESLLKEAQIRDKEDPDSYTIRALLRATHEGLNVNLKQNTDAKGSGKKSHNRTLMGNFSKHKKGGKSRSKSHSTDDDEEGQETGQMHRIGRRGKTMKLCRELSDLVMYTNSVAAQDVVDDGTTGNVLSFCETKAHGLVHQKPEQFIVYNQKQLIRLYPSAYRIDSSNFNPQEYWNVGCQLVALNYQTEGRMMQLNRAKFLQNGNCGYVLKPPQLCKGVVNPYCDDPFPANPKKQLVLKIISGQQLPKPPDSMLGDRGEIIDPFVEVEIIGFPVDCCKEQTRVVDDNGFNPVWEEVLTFTIHMPELALVRFLVWDHDPIGRDFVGQRTVAFSSLMPGYRHVYLEGLTEASIFVHVTIHDIYGKWSPLILNPSYTILHLLGATKNRQLMGLKGLFNKTPKHYSTESSSSGYGVRKRSFGDRILRRSASAPAKGRKKSKIGFQEITGEAKEGTSDCNNTDKECVIKRESKSLVIRPVSVPVDRLLVSGLTPLALDSVNDTKGNESNSGQKEDDRPLKEDCAEGMCSAPVDFLTSNQPLSEASSQDTHTYMNYLQGMAVDEQIRETESSCFKIEGGCNTEHSRTQIAVAPGNMPKRVCIEQDKETTQERVQKQEKEDNTGGKEEHSCQHSERVTQNGNPDSLQYCFDENNTLSPNDSPINMPSPVSTGSHIINGDLSMHDSTISHLIEAVSLTNDSDLGSSVSALISQFEETGDGTSLTIVSSLHGLSSHTFSLMSGYSCITTSEKSTHPNSLFPCVELKEESSPDVSADTTVFSSPETLDNSAFTIIHEEPLSTASVYNLRDRTVHYAVMNSGESSFVSSTCSSPVLSGTTLSLSNETHWNQLQAFKMPSIATSADLASDDKYSNPISVDSDGSSLTEAVDFHDTPLSEQGCSKTDYIDSIFPNSLNCTDISHQNAKCFRSCSCLFSEIDRSISDTPIVLSTDEKLCTASSQCTEKMYHNGFQTVDADSERLRISQQLPRDEMYAVSNTSSTNFHSVSVVKQPSPCKSKSLGDLTYEDISCNFQSKYKYINKSFKVTGVQDKRIVPVTPQGHYSSDHLTEQLRRLVSFEQEDDSPVKSMTHNDSGNLQGIDRKLSSRSQSRVRNIATRARERQEANKQKLSNCSVAPGVIIRKKPPAHYSANRHSTGSYIAGYLDHLNSEELNDRGIPEGACSSLHCGQNDHFYTDDSVFQTESSPTSEAEIYFLLRL